MTVIDHQSQISSDSSAETFLANPADRFPNQILHIAGKKKKKHLACPGQ